MLQIKRHRKKLKEKGSRCLLAELQHLKVMKVFAQKVALKLKSSMQHFIGGLN